MKRGKITSKKNELHNFCRKCSILFKLNDLLCNLQGKWQVAKRQISQNCKKAGILSIAGPYIRKTKLIFAPIADDRRPDNDTDYKQTIRSPGPFRTTRHPSPPPYEGEESYGRIPCQDGSITFVDTYLRSSRISAGLYRHTLDILPQRQRNLGQGLRIQRRTSRHIHKESPKGD